ncbi:phage major capsid protein [Streptomyces bikiniensis]|uniref:phage major capsid protein n=1 Tax=Streptomyces bikiniensis TaxID=1896 RepID=UPI0004C1A25C|nr:phage major capsid protein [Streptomyces bikiniensis]
MRSVERNYAMSETEKRQHIEKLDIEARDLEAMARDALERGEREAEVRSLAARSGGLFMPFSGAPDEGNAWGALVPSKSEYRALSVGVPAEGGFTVPVEVAGRYIDEMAAKSALLRGLPAENIIPFTSESLCIPQLIDSGDAGHAAEGEAIPEGDMVWGQVKLQAKKIGRIQWVSSELLEDSAIIQRDTVGRNLIRSASLKFDQDAFTGSGTNPIKGILSQGVSTTLGAGQTSITYDSIADAVARIESINGTPSVVWASVDAAASLRKEKSSGSGTYQGGAPTDSAASTAWGLPILPSAFLPPNTAIVADGSRVMVGVRRNPTIRISEDARFESDQVGFCLTIRMAGVAIAEPSSVQVIRAASS